MKIVYQTNRSYYICETFCQESPLEKGTYLIPSGAIEIKPPQFEENEIPYWNGNTWEIKPNYSNKKYFSKINKSEKTFEIGEEFNNDYTEVSPLENELFQKWDEHSLSWIVDEEAKTNQENLFRKSTIQKLLLESDYIELPSFIERKGVEIYNTWMNYRANLRSAYHDPNLPLPQAPI